MIIENKNTQFFLALAICLVVAYLLPYHANPFRAFYNDWFAIFGVVIAIALISQEKKISLRIPSIIVIPFGLILIVMIQTFFGMLTFKWDAILPIAYFIGAALCLILGATVSLSGKGASGLCKTLAYSHLFAGLVSVVIAVIQFCGVDGTFAPFVLQLNHSVAIRPYANVAQPNQLALLFCLSIASVWWLYQSGKLKATVATVMVLFLLSGLVLTQSRIGWVIIPLFFLFTWLWQQRGDNDSAIKVIAMWWSAGFTLLYGTLVICLPKIAALIGVIVVPVADHVGSGSGSERMALIQQAWQISLAHPWFGAGWYEFGSQQVQIAADANAFEYSQYAHNIIFNFAAETGWLITLSLFSALGYWFYKSCLRRHISKEIAFATLFFIAVLVHSLVEFPLWYAYVLLPTTLLMGMVHQEQFGTKKIQISRIYVTILFCVMSLSLVAVTTDYRRVVLGYRALAWESIGLKADEGSTDKPKYTLFPQYYDYFRFAKTKAHTGMSVDEIAFMERISHRFGYPPVLMRMSFVYALNAQQDNAVRAMLTLRKLYRSQYSEGYDVWKSMAEAEPEIYAAVFQRLPKPDPVLLKIKGNS